MTCAVEQAEESRLVARPGPDLEHLFRSLKRKQLGHQADDVRLRNGLPLPDGQRRIVVGGADEVGRDEPVARYGLHGLQHAPVVDAPPGDLEAHHALSFLGSAVTRLRWSVWREHVGCPDPVRGKRLCSIRRV